jgi:hypothetical protein
MRRLGLSPATKLVLNLALAVVVLVTVAVLFTHRSDEPQGPADDDTDTRLERLRSVPYTALTSYEADPGQSGVRIHERARAYGGYNLYCSRTDPEVYLMDMEGTVVHTWSRPAGDIWVWDHAVMLTNGDLIVINKFKDLLRLDWDSGIVWRRKLDAHHDIALLPDGGYYAAIRGAESYRGLVVEFPVIVLHSAEGEEIDRWYAYEHLDEIKEKLDPSSFLDTILDSIHDAGARVDFTESVPGRVEANTLSDGRVLYDYFHLNTLTVLPETELGKRDPRFRSGNLLVCFRNVNQVAILDQATWEILWTWGEGELEWPHHPTMVGDGNILIFDNGVLRKSSRVLEVEPLTSRMAWEYVADPPERFYTYEKGSAQRLPNGNTLICDGDNGRAFEATRAGEIVWEWLNPAMKKGRRVQIYRVTRIPADTVEPLLKRDEE